MATADERLTAILGAIMDRTPTPQESQRFRTAFLGMHTEGAQETDGAKRNDKAIAILSSYLLDVVQSYEGNAAASAARDAARGAFSATASGPKQIA